MPKRKAAKRENGTGTVYKRKDVKSRPWVAFGPATPVVDEDTQKVRMIQPPLGSYATAQEAKDALEEYRRNPTPLYNVTLEQLHDEWLPTGYKGLSKSAIYCYNAAWYKLRPLYKDKFKSIRLNSYMAVIDYYDTEHQAEGIGGKPKVDEDGNPVMCAGLSRSSLEDIKKLLSRMYKYAIINGLVQVNIASFITLPDKVPASKKRFNDLQYKLIENNIKAIPLMDLIYLLCNTGHRIGEFLSLTPADAYDYKGSILLYGGNKTEAGEDKIVPVPRHLNWIVDKYRAYGGETLFCKPDGSAWTTDNFRDHFKEALASIGLDGFTPHACRRTYSTRLSAAGVGEADIIRLMGHTDFEVDIQHYIKQEADTLIRAVDRLA